MRIKKTKLHKDELNCYSLRNALFWGVMVSQSVCVCDVYVCMWLSVCVCGKVHLCVCLCMCVCLYSALKFFYFPVYNEGQLVLKVFPLPINGDNLRSHTALSMKY